MDYSIAIGDSPRSFDRFAVHRLLCPVRTVQPFLTPIYGKRFQSAV